MELITDINTWNFRGEGIVTIGAFDGVHFGHQRILTRLNELKTEQNQKTIVFTFNPHPRKVLFPEQTDLQMLTSRAEKLKLIESLGTDILIEFPFSLEFSQIEPLDFISEILVKKLHVKKLVIGYDHKFGKNREGNLQTFKEQATKYNYTVEEIPAQEIDDINISSTKIRKALFDGSIKEATKYLGYFYPLQGKVVEGKKLGRTIGYPTANIQLFDKEKLIPKTGVYLTRVEVNGGDYYGMMNIGFNPTTDSDNKLKLEVNIFNFDKDIYGKEIDVKLIERIRDEEKFNSIEELKNKIKSDETICKQLIQQIG